ncbi:MAG: cob(I)yrinic acid a,c-diamide adenosyltransferase [Aureliella sp.]
MKIYTKTGDDGTTGLFAGGRVPKDHPRITAYGSVDELNALLGVAASQARTGSGGGEPDSASLALLVEILAQVQNDLFSIGSELASPHPTRSGTKLLRDSDVQRLETWIDRVDGQLEPLTCFIIPGGSLFASWLHSARTVCRRAERDVVALTHQAEVESCQTVLVYLNRLSDLLFVMARLANRAVGLADVPWTKPT